MKNSRFVWLALPVMLTLGNSLMPADTITDTSLGVSYTATSTFTPVTDNTYDVFLTVNTSGFNKGSGFLDAVSLAYKTNSDVASSVTLLAAPGGTVDWSSAVPGGLNATGCNGNGANSGDVCFQYTGSSTTVNKVPDGTYTFEFAVTMPGTDALTAASDIKAAYSSTITDSQSTNLGLTSMAITIQHGTPPAVPEPASLFLFTSGLVGLAFAAKFRKHRPGTSDSGE